MDEEKQSGPSKRRKVLRAKDVIPPFDTDREEAGKAGPGEERSALLSPNLPTFAPSHVPAGPSPQASEIPRYDLAENILAEQRRAAGRRRRAPGQVPEVPRVTPSAAGVRMFLPEIASPDLLELQRLVAEIVARDIDRLCQPVRGSAFRRV